MAIVIATNQFIFLADYVFASHDVTRHMDPCRSAEGMQWFSIDDMPVDVM